MTTISSTTTTSHHKHHRVKPQVQADASAAPTPAADGQGSASGMGGGVASSGVSIDKLLSHVIDLLQKLQATADGKAGEGDDGLESMVAAMDSDGDGSVSSAEFVAARPADVSEEQAAGLFQSFDTQGAGSLSVQDLAEAMKRDRGHHGHDRPEGSNDLFSALDTNKDGSVSRDELSAGLQNAQQARDSDITALLRLLGGKDV